MSKKTASAATSIDDAGPSEVRLRISANLKKLRKEQGLSQEKLAEISGFHRTYVSQLERCITNISIDGLGKVAKALEVDVRELLKP